MFREVIHCATWSNVRSLLVDSRRYTLRQSILTHRRVGVKVVNELHANIVTRGIFSTTPGKTANSNRRSPLEVSGIMLRGSHQPRSCNSILIIISVSFKRICISNPMLEKLFGITTFKSVRAIAISYLADVNHLVCESNSRPKRVVIEQQMITNTNLITVYRHSVAIP